HPKEELMSKEQSKKTETASRRKFLTSAAVATAGAATLGFPMIAKGQAGPISMRWQSTWPSKDIFHEYALDYAKKVNDMTGGDRPRPARRRGVQQRDLRPHPRLPGRVQGMHAAELPPERRAVRDHLQQDQVRRAAGQDSGDHRKCGGSGLRGYVVEGDQPLLA